MLTLSSIHRIMASGGGFGGGTRPYGRDSSNVGPTYELHQLKRVAEKEERSDGHHHHHNVVQEERNGVPSFDSRSVTSMDSELCEGDKGRGPEHGRHEGEPEQTLEDAYDLCDLDSDGEDLQYPYELEWKVYDLRRDPRRNPSRRTGGRGQLTKDCGQLGKLIGNMISGPREPHRESTNHRRLGSAERSASAAHRGCDLDLPGHHHSESFLGLCHGVTDEVPWHMEPCGHIVTEDRELDMVMFDGERFPQQRILPTRSDCGHDTWPVAIHRA